MSFAKIVVGTDFSEKNEAVVQQALQIARRHGAELILVHAGEMPEHAEVPPQIQDIAEQYEKRLDERFTDARARLEGLRERIAGQGPEISQLFVTGFADEAIPEAARSAGADLIVIGTQGHTGLKRLVLGSTAERIVRMSSGTVLVARSTGAEKSLARGGYHRVLVPLAFSDYDARALDTALALVADDGELELVNFWQVPGAVYMKGRAGLDWANDLRLQIAKGAEDLLGKHAEAIAARHSGTVTHSAKEGDPRDGIQDTLEAGDYQLVVMGSHGRRGFRRWTLGSVAEVIVRHAPCSVAVVHREEAEDAP